MALIWSWAARNRCACLGDLNRPMIFLPPPRRPVAALNSVVEALVGPMIGTRCLAGDRFYVAAQHVFNNDPGMAELSNQPCRKALGGLRVAACLNQNVERVAIGVHSAPQSVLHAID